MEVDVVDLSRLQFAATAMYHFVFVPLTLGLSILVATMETFYVMTGRPIWRQMANSGAQCSGSTLSWAWPPGSRWNSSSA